MQKRYHRILNAVSQEAWAIHPRKGAVLKEILLARVTGDTSAAKFTPSQDRKVASQQGGVMVIPMQGVVANRMDMFDDISGGMSCEKFSKDFQTAMNDDNIKAIIFDVDSPGGAVSGVPELAKIIFDARGKKPMVAVVNTDCFSAAYWLASAADEIVVTPSGEVGSIGVYTLHEDMSEQLKMLGLKETFISFGDHKVEGNPFEPLSEEAKAYMKTRVDAYGEMFVADVARNRGVSKAQVLKDYGQGRCIGAEDAVKLGMADRTGTMQETLARFGVALYSSPNRANASTTTARNQRAVKIAKARESLQ